MRFSQIMCSKTTGLGTVDVVLQELFNLDAKGVPIDTQRDQQFGLSYV